MRRAACFKYGRGASRILAVAGMALAMAGCSGSSRFDMPSWGLAGKSASSSADWTTTSSLPPVPAETVYSSGNSRYHYYGANNRPPGAPGAQSSVPRVTPAAYTPAPAAPPPPRYRETKAPRPEPTAMRATKPQATGGFRITVGQGDTLASLSKRYAVPVEEIVSANDLADARLDVGQEIFIPTAAPKAAAKAAAPAPTAPGEKTYKVAPGDTLNSIAQKLGVSSKALADRNDVRPHQLQVGQTLVVPTGQDSPAVRTVKTTTVLAPGTPSSETAADSGNQQRIASVDQLPAPEPMTAANFRWPVQGRIIAGFGPRPDGSHNDGINVSVPQGTSVLAAENGVVAYAGNELKGYGNLVLIRHANNWVSAYAHNEALLVKRGEKVRRGQVIAKAGASGSVNQPQVHFELRKGSRPVDPIKYMGDATASND